MKKKMMMMMVGVLSSGMAFGVGDLKTAWETGKRAETLDWFRREMFGYAPPRPADETFDDEGVSFAGGKIKIRVHRALPKGACAENPAPVFLLLDHYNGAERTDGLWHRPGTPTNSITARGYAYVNVNLNDVALNCYDDRWSNKVHTVYGGGKPDSWGTLSAWAWGVSRVLDWIEQRPELDAKRVAVVGHSRGGKTALWAAAQDERIAMAVPNCSGTGGTRWLDTELVDAEPLEWMLGHSIKTWFCGNLMKYRDNVRELPYTTADLIRLVCPRLVYVSSGSEDSWAGPQGEFASALQASDLWRAYGLKGLSLEHFPRPGTWDDSGRVGYALHEGPHKLGPWNWERFLDFADRHLKRGGDGGDGVQRATAGDAPELYGRPVPIQQRVDPVSARFYGQKQDIALTAWRGERVHAQVVVWSDADQKKLSLSAEDFVSAAGGRIASGRVAGRFVRTVETAFVPRGARHLTADCLDAAAGAWPDEKFRAVWFTLDVPADAQSGVYTGAYVVKGAGGEVRFPATLTVSPHALPPVAERKFFLDLWQHPWTVAKHHGVKPFSPEHYRLMEPIYRELAAGGQKAITTSIVDLPWGEHYGEASGLIRTMVGYVKNPDGTFTADFKTFDEFVQFARKCGVGPQIHCYTVCKFNSKHIFYYTDAATGERRAEELYEGTRAYESFLTPLLVQLEAHLKAKGWLSDAYIAIDEVPPERLPVVRQFLKRVAPRLKFALASNVDPLRYAGFEKDVDVFSQLLATCHGITNMFLKSFDDGFLANRRAGGRTTTFYVCTAPQQPNTWFKSPLVETEWLGLYAAAHRYDGFLRWAAFFWSADPQTDPAGIGGYPTGEDFLLYPGGLASVRWEFLRDSIENWEKIRILRETGKATSALEKALGNLNYPFTGRDDSDPFSLRQRVDAVLKAIDDAAEVR